MRDIRSLDIILAGGPGTRLHPITRDRAKPAAPFGGKYRIIDLALNNHANSGSRDVVVVAQYKPVSLIRHIENAWRLIFEREREEFIKLAQPTHKAYRGTADAVYQNVARIEQAKPHIVTVFCGDHIYLMDISQMKRFHLDSGADLTIAAIPVKKELAKGNLGVIIADQSGDIKGFEEKVHDPSEIPEMKGYCWASMGNYVFNRDVLITALKADAKKVYVLSEQKEIVLANPDFYTSNDFGFNVIPMLMKQGKRVKMYDFRNNHPDLVPVTGYWRDVGTLDQFVEANMDLTGIDPVLVLDNPGWPLVTFDESHGKPIIGEELAVGSILANGIDNRGNLIRCVVSYNTIIGENTHIENSILMGHNVIGRNVKIRNAVLDRGVKVADGITIDMSPAEAAARQFVMSRGGYVFIPRNYEFR